MAKWRSKPQDVDAFQILDIEAIPGQTDLILHLDNGIGRRTNPDMLRRCMPAVGDYLVVQRGYDFLKPRTLFYYQYEPLEGAPGTVQTPQSPGMQSNYPHRGGNYRGPRHGQKGR